MSTTTLPATRTATPMGTGDLLDLSGIDPELHAWLEGHIAGEGLTRTDAGRRLGYADGTAVSRYLNRKFEGDLAEFERRLADYIALVSAQAIHLRGEFFPTSVSRQVTLFLNGLRAASKAAGLVCGPAGIGKTLALNHYASKNSNTILLTLDAAHRTGKGVSQNLWKIVGKRGYKANTPRWDHLVARYAGSGTLFLVDNAQRLTTDGLDWIYDFGDATGCTFCFAGNPSILGKIALVDQHFTRTFPVKKPTLKNVPDVAEKIVAQHFPEAVAELREMAVQVASRTGYLRTLVMCLKAARTYMEFDGFKGDPAAAFAAARANSVHA